MDDQLFNIVIEPRLLSNPELMNTFKETLRSRLDFDGRSKRPFIIIYRPQSRLRDGIEETLKPLLQDRKNVVLIIDFNEDINKENILTPDLRMCVIKIFTISAPKGKLNWGVKTNKLALDELCDCLEAEFQLKKREVTEGGSVQGANKRQEGDESDPLVATDSMRQHSQIGTEGGNNIKQYKNIIIIIIIIGFVAFAVIATLIILSQTVWK